MAWRCSGKSNAELVRNLMIGGLVKSKPVETAMLRVERGHYTRGGGAAHEDAPQPIGYSQTISAPHMHAMCLETLGPFLRPGMRALDCGSGSGYLVGCLASMVGATGTVRGVEYVSELVPYSLDNLRKDGWGAELDSGAVQVRHGDGSKGWDGEVFDAIHVGAAAPHIPKPLVDALAAPGRMVIPVGTSSQALLQVDKDKEGKVDIKELSGVMYVPFHMESTEAYRP